MMRQGTAKQKRVGYNDSTKSSELYSVSLFNLAPYGTSVLIPLLSDLSTS
jgi:hypothetical protein